MLTTKRSLETGLIRVVFAAAALTSASSCMTEVQISALPSALASAAPSGAEESKSLAAESSTGTIPSGARAAKIIFKTGFPAGSFPSAPSTGTKPAPGYGLGAVRVHNADGSLLASKGDTAWPKWLTSVEIGVSGSTNTAATNANCARFSASGEGTTTVCNYDDDAATTSRPCGAPAGYYRVSEYDCTASSSTTDGSGGPNDGVYIRASFSRNTEYLGSTENIMAVLEYSANALNQPPTDPKACFGAGTFDPKSSDCTDLVWQIYLKHNLYEVVQPYLMLVPPAINYVDRRAYTLDNGGAGATTGSGGGSIAAKQFYLPFAGDKNLSVLQLSRIKAIKNSAQDFTDICSSNSAHCVGMVFYSLTFFRI